MEEDEEMTKEGYLKLFKDKFSLASAAIAEAKRLAAEDPDSFSIAKVLSNIKENYANKNGSQEQQ